MKRLILTLACVYALIGYSADLAVEAPSGGDRVVDFAKKELLRVLKGVEGRIVLREEKDLKPQQWRFRSEADGTLVISGRDGMGIAYGVFTFLEKHAGAAWYAPDTEVLPNLQGWKLPRLDETGAPAFLDREMYVGTDYMDGIWRLRNKETRRAAFGVGIRPGKPGACHTFAAYTKALKAAHPELFGKRLAANGRVCNTLCLTDPVTRAFVAEEMCRYIEQDAEAARKAGDPSYAVPSIYEISQDDGGSSDECMCERCKALAEAEGSYSGPMIDFASEVARRVGARHPEVFVQTFAYSYTMKPPKTVKGADNLFVRYCDSRVFAPLLRGTPQGDALEEWGHHAANISLWGYWRNYTGKPLPMMKRIADIGAELRFVRDCHVKNYFAEDEAPLSRSFAMLQHWLFLKLAENPDQDEQTLARRFMSAYYGAAARPMTQFRDYLERRQESTYAYLDREFFEKTNAWLDEAERLVADDARSLGHVRWERVIVDRGAFLTFADTRKQGYKMDVKAVAARLRANHRELLTGWTALKIGGKTTLERRLKAADDEAMIYANYPVAIPERFAGKTVVDRLSIDQAPSAAKLVNDPDAAAGYAFYIPKTKAALPFSFGFYHAESKSRGEVWFKAKADVPQDEKFHLYRVGRSALLKGFYVWFDPTWRYRCWEKTIGIVPEEWDVWVSAKFTGPAFVEGSTEENRVLFDRVLFVKPDGESADAGANGGGAASVEITPDYAIVVPDARPDDVPKHLAAVARELAHDIEESTGMRLPVVSAKDVHPKAKGLYIGEMFAEREGLLPKDRPLENFDYVVAEKDGSIYLFGHDRTRFADPGRKTQWWRQCLLASGRAVVSFMENEMGVAFLAPGRAGRDIPKKKSLAVRKGVYRLRRESQIAGVSRELEMMYDLASGIYGLGTWRSHGGHLYPAAVPFAKYAKSHPEYFPLHGNARVKSNGVNALCISNPEVEQLLVDFIVAEMDDGADIVELGQNDGTSWCQCEKCRAYAGTAPGDWGEKFWIFHRRIAEKVNALRPEKTVQIISYGPTAMPPRTFTAFPPNVMIELMNCRPAALSAWRNYKVARGFSNYVYHWGDYPSPGFTAKNSVAAMAAAARKYREYGIKIVYRCGYGELFGTEGPAYYVFNKLLFEPSLDETEVFGQYVSRAYGPAAKAMMKFHALQDERIEMYNALDAGIDGNRRVVPKHAADMLAALYPPDVLAKLGNLLAAAERTAGLSAKHAMRLRLVRLEYDYLVHLIRPIHLYFGYLAAPSTDTFRPLADALESRASFIDSLGDGKGRVRGIEGWDRLHPFFPTGRFDRKRLATNGRLSARLDAPFAWDAKAMLAKGFLPGKTKVEVRVPSVEWRSGGVRECGSETFDFEQGAWAAAKWNELNGLQLEKIANRTRFKVVAGMDALYLAVETTLPDDRKYEPTGHDSSCYLRDCIDFAIAPDMAGDKAYHFVFGPVENSSLEEALGLITDELDPKYGTYDGEWNGEWSYAPVRADGLWRTRVKIPYATLGVTRPAPGAKWRMNLGRLAEPDSKGSTPYAYCEFSSWSPNFESRSFADLGAMGEVVFE